MKRPAQFGRARETEESLEDLYEHAPCGYLSTTMDGSVVRVNETLLSWTGYQRSELIGQSLVSFLTPGSQLLFETRYQSVVQLRGEAKEVALSMRRADGHDLPVLMNGVVISDEKGQPRAIRTAIFHANQRQEYERELLASRRLAEASEARVRLLQDASSTFGAASTEAELADRLSASAREAFAASSASVYLLNQEGTTELASAEAALGLTGLSRDGPARVLLDGAGMAVLSRTGILAESPELAAVMRDARVETVTTVPLSEGTTRLGLLISSFGRVRSFDASDAELHEALARQAANILTRLRLQRQLEHLALYDQLTGLASRRLVQRLLAEAVTSSQLHRRSMALLFVDLDGFKAINDGHGHAAGDRVLSEIGARLSSNVRTGDMVGRLGGDEFVVICQDVDPESTRRVVDRLHAALSEPLPGHASGARVTCSIGVALYSGDDPVPPELLLQRADEAMYRSKSAGKNRTTTVMVLNSPAGDPLQGQSSSR